MLHSDKTIKLSIITVKNPDTVHCNTIKTIAKYATTKNAFQIKSRPPRFFERITYLQEDNKMINFKVTFINIQIKHVIILFVRQIDTELD